MVQVFSLAVTKKEQPFQKILILYGLPLIWIMYYRIFTHVNIKASL